MIALNFEHRTVAQHTFKVELFGREGELFESCSDALNHYVIVDISDQLDYTEALYLAADHDLILL